MGTGTTPGRSSLQLLERVVWLAGRYIQLLNAGWGLLAGQYKRRRAGQNISDVGGGGGGRVGFPGQEGTHWTLYTFITHKRLPPCQQFSASQDAHSIL